MLSSYAPVIAMIIVGAAFVLLTLVVSERVGPKRYNRARLDSYECGVQPTPGAADGGRFPIKYYLTAMTFIIFDIEIIFLYPWAVHFDQLGVFGFLAMLSFLVLISVPFVYEWRRGGLDWD